MNRLAFVNAKGGIGKTTSAVLVACALAEHGKTALIDSDPQRSATAWHAFATESGSPLPLALVDSLRTPLPEDLEWVVLDTPPGDEQLIRNAQMRYLRSWHTGAGGQPLPRRLHRLYPLHVRQGLLLCVQFHWKATSF